MQNNYRTERLVINALALNDAVFIAELVNTPEWIQFIGDKKIRTQEDARAYIEKIMNNPKINYWVVRLADKKTSIGIITFIKRDYLEHYDIGFAFLLKFTKKGYAHEATSAVLNDIIGDPTHTKILAITIRENINSIKLLERLGLRFENEIKHGNDWLLIYAISVDQLLINQITDLFYSLFTNADLQVPVLERIYGICLPETILINKTNEAEGLFDLASFIEPRKKMLSDGTLTEFEEYQIFEETRIAGNMAQRLSGYRKKGYRNREYFEANGNKMFQYVKTSGGWKITSVVWEDEKV